MVLGKSRILPSTSNQPMPPSTPMTAAKNKAAATLPITLPGSIPPCVCTCKMAKTPTIHKTSVNADSSTKTVAGLSDKCREFTIGMTTADEVPPNVTPSRTAGNNDNPSMAKPTPPTINAVNAKQVNVSTPVVANELLIVPKSSSMTMPSMGPITMPTSINTSTSGMLVLLNCRDRKWAKNTISPMTRIVADIWNTTIRPCVDFSLDGMRQLRSAVMHT